MSTTQRPPYDLVESFDTITYRLPRRPRGAIAVVGAVLLVVGLLPLGFGSAFLGVMFWMARGGPVQFLLMAALMSVVPLIFVALGLAILFAGLHAIVGRDEVGISPGDVRGIMRAGPFRWTRSVRRDRLRQFTVVRSATPPVAAGLAPGNEFNLRAELEGGKSKILLRSYPHDVVLALAADLAMRCKTLPMDAADFVETPPKVVVREESDVPTDIRERDTQPPDSAAILERSEGYLRISLPPAGFWRGSPAFIKFFVFFWCAITSLLVVAFTVTVWTGGKVERQGGFPESNWFLVLFFTPFVLIGIGGLLGLIHCGRRRAELTVSGQDLAIDRWEWFRATHRQWRRDELRSLGVHVQEHRDSENGTTWIHTLRIVPRDGEPAGFLSYRPKAELEWIATTLRRSLQLPSG